MNAFKSLKSLALILCTAVSLCASPSHAAGTLPLAMAQQIDINGQPLACIVYFFQAGTVATPQNSYSDFGLSLNPNPQLSCDQTGRIPMFWLADGLVHVRMTDSTGLSIIDTTMQVLGPSSGGGGGGGTVDPTAILSTGDLKVKYGTGALSGFVRCNGLTIGNGTSGATERANADTQPAFVYLYAADPNLVVSGGRTGNALSDYNAGKTIATPDWRGRALAALDDMGNSAAGRLTATYFGTAATVLGAAGGAESQALTIAQLPDAPPLSGATSNTLNIAHPMSGNVDGGTSSASSFRFGNNTTGPTTFNINPTGTVTVTGHLGSGNAHPIASPMMLATIYMKL